jgi:hypothetical protein
MTDLPPSLRLAHRAFDSPLINAFGDHLCRVEMFHRITGGDQDATLEALQHSEAWQAAWKEYGELTEDDKAALHAQIADQLNEAARVGGQMTAATLRTVGQDPNALVDHSHAPDVVMTVGAALWLQGVRPEET